MSNEIEKFYGGPDLENPGKQYPYTGMDQHKFGLTTDMINLLETLPEGISWRERMQEIQAIKRYYDIESKYQQERSNIDAKKYRNLEIQISGGCMTGNCNNNSFNNYKSLKNLGDNSCVTHTSNDIETQLNKLSLKYQLLTDILTRGFCAFFSSSVVYTSEDFSELNHIIQENDIINIKHICKQIDSADRKIDRDFYIKQLQPYTIKYNNAKDLLFTYINTLKNIQIKETEMYL